jgi:hypothetical protein
MRPGGDDEFERFEDLTRQLVQTPKPSNGEWLMPTHRDADTQN